MNDVGINHLCLPIALNNSEILKEKTDKTFKQGCGVGVGVGSRSRRSRLFLPESESESESIKINRLRLRAGVRLTGEF